MAQERAPDRTSQPFESVKHDEPHAHPEPVPHLAPEGAASLDDHGPDVSHPHVHQQGGGHSYDHHPVAVDDGNDSTTTAADPLKSAGAAADNHNP